MALKLGPEYILWIELREGGDLEQVAINYTFLSESELKLIHYLLVIVGAVAAAIFSKTQGELERAPFFFGLAVVSLCLTIAEYVWLASFEATAGGFLWALFMTSVSLKLVGGYAIGVIAIARSRDAYGHGKLAFLTFIPILGLVLILKGSKNTTSINKIPTIKIASGFLGVVSGFIAFGGMIAAFVYLNQRLDETLNLNNAQLGNEHEWIASIVSSRGLEATLRYIVAQNFDETRIDEITVLKGISANGKVLTRNYVVEKDVDFFNENFKSTITKSICDDKSQRALINGGATVLQKYNYTDGRSAGTNSVSFGDCAIADAKTPEAIVVAMIKHRGLENTLKHIAAASRGNKRIDEITVLKSVSADMKKLIRHYVVEREIGPLSSKFGKISATSVCQHKFLRELLEAGATISEQYNYPNGIEIGAYTITIRSCE